MISINFFSEPEDRKPDKKEKGQGPLLPLQEWQAKGEEDSSSSSGSIPDPEPLDFDEHEDEDPGSDNLNGEENEEPGQGKRSGFTEKTKELIPAHSENAEQKDSHDY